MFQWERRGLEEEEEEEEALLTDIRCGYRGLFPSA
jgi:hypothetical protein